MVKNLNVHKNAQRVLQLSSFGEKCFWVYCGYYRFVRSPNEVKMVLVYNACHVSISINDQSSTHFLNPISPILFLN